MQTNWEHRTTLGMCRKTFINFVFAAVILAGLLACRTASALMIPLATPTLIDSASCIVEGRVTNLCSRWTDDHSAIVTEVTIDVTDVLLGDTNRVIFLYKGGVVGDLAQRVSDMPVVRNGQQVLVFLRALTPEEANRDRPIATRELRHTLVGAAQGLYRIEGRRAIKDGFKVLGDPAVIEHDVDLTTIKTRIRERLAASRQEGGVR
jgi:hypothetical protein